LRDWLVDSDAALDPQAFVLRPDVVLRLSRQILEEPTPYRRTRRAVLAVLEELTLAHAGGLVKLPPREVPWLDSLRQQADTLPEQEEELTAQMLRAPEATRFLPAEYGLAPAGRP
jgi:methanol--5-hydroxybenzimidazolylcobamide Co-methyltransferase